MRSAYPSLGWFLVLTLFSLGACNPLFLIPACEYDPSFEFCQQSGGDMGSQVDGNIFGTLADLDGPVMKQPISFTLVATTPLTTMRKWVGIHPPNLLLFANQTTGTSVASIQPYELLERGPGWTITPAYCQDCLVSIKDVNLTTDYLLTSKSTFFLITSNFAYLVERDGTKFDSLNTVDSLLSTGFRPFVSPNNDVFSFQRKVRTGGDVSQINFYHNSTESGSISFANRTITPNTTYYVIGDLEGEEKNIFDDEVLIFEDNKLAGAYRFNTSKTPIFDSALTDEINKFIIRMRGNIPYPIRTGFIADLNHDGYMELVYALHREIFAATYDPHAAIGSRFISWPQPICTIDSVDYTVASSSADLNDDGYPDIAIETINPNRVYFYLNNKE